MDSLKVELDPILTPKQKERFEQRLKRPRRPSFDRPGRRSRGRPFDREPGHPPPDAEKKAPFFP